MNILITGGKGFIGASLEKRLQKLKHHTSILDINFGDKILNENEIKFDIRDSSISKKFANKKYDVIFHLAAQTSGLISEENPTLDFETNILGTYNLIKIAKLVGARKIVFTSSMAVYGNTKEKSQVDENEGLKPLSNYGVSKLTAEHLLINSEVDITIFRLFNVYGPGQNLENMKQGMVSIFLAQYIRDSQIKVTGSLKRYRDFIYIDDVVNALIYGLNQETSGQIYNVGSDKKTTVLELLNTINNLDKQLKPIVELNGHKGDTFGIFSSSQKLRKLGWENKTELKKGLKITYNFIK